MLRPFWSYYGGKWRAAPLYPAPVHGTIVEPFAGAAGYSLRYPDRKVILIDIYPKIAELWRYLICTPAAEIRAIPLVENVDDLPASTPEGARTLVGFCLTIGGAHPQKTLTGMCRQHGGGMYGFTAARRERVARQVDRIRHWKIIEGPYRDAPDIDATWFVDPPYASPAGRHYVHSDIDYLDLGDWCYRRKGQLIVCENAGADWAPFTPLATFQVGPNGKRSEEVVWRR